MANTLSTTKMTNPIKGLVSKRRIRYTKDGFNLDLTYINDRIIAMGYPAEQLEAIYRNNIDDVQQMLEKNHAGYYKIYNLCSERSYNSERFPNYSVYPFKDHNPPEIGLITKFCQDVDEHLRADSKHVVAVHCKAGKGRTGTMICCYLLYSRQFNNAADALHYYAQRRTSNSKGVTIPSQRRYVEYYDALLKSNETYKPVTLYICEIRLSPAVNIKEGTVNEMDKSPQPLPEFKRTEEQTVAKMDYCMPLTGDIKIELVKITRLRKEKRCHFWFNAYFVDKSAIKDADGNLLLTLSKTEIDDAHKDKHHKEYPSDFKVEVVLQRVPPGRFADSVNLKMCHRATPLSANANINFNQDSNDQQQMLPQHQLPTPRLQMLQQQHQQRQAHISPRYYPVNANQHSGTIDYIPRDLPVQNNIASDRMVPLDVANVRLQKESHTDFTMIENNHSVDHSEALSSSSESSTEEEGWDSGTAVGSRTRHPHVTNSSNGNSQHTAHQQQQRQSNHHVHPCHPHHDEPYEDDSNVNAVGHCSSSCSPGGSSSRASVASVSAPKAAACLMSPIKKSASAVETLVTSAANKLNNLRRMSTNAISSFNAHNSNNFDRKFYNKSSASDNLISLPRSGAQHQPAARSCEIGSNPSSPTLAPIKLFGHFINNDHSAGGVSSTANGPPVQRDSLPILGGLLSSFSSSSVSSSNSSSLSPNSKRFAKILFHSADDDDSDGDGMIGGDRKTSNDHTSNSDSGRSSIEILHESDHPPP